MWLRNRGELSGIHRVARPVLQYAIRRANRKDQTHLRAALSPGSGSRRHEAQSCEEHRDGTDATHSRRTRRERPERHQQRDRDLRVNAFPWRRVPTDASLDGQRLVICEVIANDGIRDSGSALGTRLARCRGPTNERQTSMPQKKRNLAQLEPMDEEDGSVNVIVETPRGARTKLNWDKEREAFVVKKLLPQGMSFPFDFGFIPSTLADDGDPLDVLVLMDEAVPPGTIVPSRLVGVIEAKQTERDGTVEENHRLIAVSLVSELFADVRKLADVPPAVVSQIEHFFINYNHEAGKQFEPTGHGGPRRAQTILDEAHRKHR